MVLTKIVGVSLLESLFIIAIVMTLALFAAPSFVEWRTLVEFSNEIKRITNLTKFGRSLAMTERTAITFVIVPGAKGCLGLTSDASCDCRHVNSCQLFGLEKQLSFVNFKASITTTVDEKVSVTFDGTHGMSFNDALTISITHANHSGKVIISNLGRVRYCAVASTVGIPQC